MLFLNNESQEDQPDSYTGGTLVIWNCGNPQKPVLRVEGETGKVTAFPSDLMHQIEAVRSGERYSIVNWFF